MASTLWIGTRKGAFALRPGARRRRWKVAGPQFLGHIIQPIVQDPREPKSLLMAAKPGHLGPTAFRSADRGRTWREASPPPAFRKVVAGEVSGRVVERDFWLTPGQASQRASWYAGGSPAGLLRSEDGGDLDEQDGIRRHIRLFINAQEAKQLSHPLRPGDALHLICALSGG